MNLARIVEREVAVDLVGGDVVEPGAVRADGFQQGVGADDVGLQERVRVVQGVVVVGFGGVVDDRVGGGDQFVDQGCVGDVTSDECHAVGGQTVQ